MRVENLQSVQKSKPWLADGLNSETVARFPIKIDPAQFSNKIGLPVTMGAAAAYGATSLTVTALGEALPAGTILDFGKLDAVTVTINDASISAGDTFITVLPLSGFIPSGTRLNFSGGANAQVVEVNGDHAKGVTTLTVLPVDGTVANSATATFAGGKKIAVLSAAAAVGATTLTVHAIGLRISSGDKAYAFQFNKKNIPGGILVGRTYTERDAGTAFGPAAVTDDEIYILADTIEDADNNPEGAVIRPGVGIKENYLPEYSSMDDVIAQGAAPTATGATSGGTLAAGTFYAAYTFVNKYGEENQFAVSASTTVASGTTGIVTVTGLPALPVGAVSMNIYLGSGNTAADLKRVAEGVTTDTYVISQDPATDAPNPVSVSANYATGLLAAIRRIYQCYKGA